MENTTKNNRTITLLFYTICLIAFGVCFYLYSPALSHSYVWDDASMVFKRADYLRDDWVSYIFTEPFFVSPNYYRPLTTFLLYLDFRAGNANPVLSHGINLIIFFVNVSLIVFVMKETGGKLKLNIRETYISCIIGLLFYIFHTSLIESTVWISGRFDLTLTSFILLAFLFDIKCQHILPRAIGTSCCFLLAALCKEMAIVFLPVLIIWHYLLAFCKDNTSINEYFNSHAFRENLIIYIVIFIAGLAYLAIRYLALGYLLVDSYSDYGDFGNRLAAISKAFFLYFRILLFPFIQPSITYPQIYPVSITDPGVFAGVLLACIILLLCLLRYQEEVKTLLLCTLIFFISILPIIHIAPLPIGDNIVNERFLTLPIALFSLCLVPLYYKIKSHLGTIFKVLFSGLFAIYVAISVVSLHYIVPLWKNDISLWLWTYNVHKSDMVILNLSEALMSNGHFKDAYEMAASVENESVMSVLRMGDAALAMGNYDEAQQLYWRAINSPNIPPSNIPVLYANIAYMKILTNKLDGVKKLLEISLSGSPSSARSHFYLALYYYKKTNFNAAFNALDDAIKFSAGEPHFQSSYRQFKDQFRQAQIEYNKTGNLLPVFTNE